MIPDQVIETIVKTSENMGQVRNTIHRLETIDQLISFIEMQLKTDAWTTGKNQEVQQ
jgi:hypothetical protein